MKRYKIVESLIGWNFKKREDTRRREIEKQLLKDEKQYAEHVILVDLGQNDIGKGCWIIISLAGMH